MKKVVKKRKKIKIPAGFPTLEEIRKTYGISKKEFHVILCDIEKFLKKSGLTAGELIRMLKNKPDEIIEIRPKNKCLQKQDELQKVLRKIAKFY